MRSRKTLLVCSLLLASAGFAALSLTRGQEGSPVPQIKSVLPQVESPAPEPRRPARDPTGLPPLQQQMYLCAQRGGDWLRRANRPDGRFLSGYVPALKTPLEGDHYLRQAGAAFALARLATFLGDERSIAVARQALLTLLLDTVLDPDDANIRHTSLPALVVNRLGAAALLVMGINELPDPGEDLLQQSEQLCAFLRKQQAADGSLTCADAGMQSDVDPEAINFYPGEALYALLRSQRYRPAPWKIEAVRKAAPFYLAWWRGHQNPAFVPWQTAAWVDAYMLTKEQRFADFVYEMNDWLGRLQYQQIDPRHPLWIGGFMEWTDNKAVSAAPNVLSACYAEGLAEAWRLSRETGDSARQQRYREALERSLQFLTTLQYTEGNTQHFADWYRPALLGAFHASHQDGNVRLDYAQHALCALVQYMRYALDG